MADGLRHRCRNRTTGYQRTAVPLAAMQIQSRFCPAPGAVRLRAGSGNIRRDFGGKDTQVQHPACMGRLLLVMVMVMVMALYMGVPTDQWGAEDAC